MKNAILTADISGVLTILIILYGECFESKQKEKSKKKLGFINLLVSVLLALVMDAISYIPYNWTNIHTMHHVFTMFAFITPFLVYALFLRYIYLHVSARYSIAKLPFRIGMLFCAFVTFIGLYYGNQGRIFILDDVGYTTGDYYEGYIRTYIVVLIYTIIVVLFNHKKIGLHDSIAAVIFMIIPLLFVFINNYDTELAFSVPSLAVSMLVINTMLQAENESNLIESEKATSKLAHSDELTGLQNRLAFSKVCDKLSDDGNIGVVFADLNGLKYANDNFGHKAGDKLLCDFSEILLSCFRKDDLFRISGDEFVVLLPDMPLETFNIKSQALTDKINSREIPIAAAGYVYGDKKEINKLIELAEEKMYADKAEFHEKYPLYSRGH